MHRPNHTDTRRLHGRKDAKQLPRRLFCALKISLCREQIVKPMQMKGEGLWIHRAKLYGLQGGFGRGSHDIGAKGPEWLVKQLLIGVFGAVIGPEKHHGAAGQSLVSHLSRCRRIGHRQGPTLRKRHARQGRALHHMGIAALFALVI